MLKNYNDILEMQSNGLCESCAYGFARCLEDGRARCKDYRITIKEESDEQQESI